MAEREIDYQKALAIHLRISAIIVGNEIPDTTFVQGMSQKRAREIYEVFCRIDRIINGDTKTQSDPKNSQTS